jgi:hypothetical protein
MTPKTKKLLMIGGAAIAGYVVYTQIKKRSAAPAPKRGIASAVATQISKVGGAEEDLGVSQDLGSLGGGF